MKKNLIMLTLVLININIVGCGIVKTDEDRYFIGEIKDINGTEVTVSSDENGEEVNLQLEDNHDFEIGDNVKIEYGGNSLEDGMEHTKIEKENKN